LHKPVYKEVWSRESVKSKDSATFCLANFPSILWDESKKDAGIKKDSVEYKHDKDDFLCPGVTMTELSSGYPLSGFSGGDCGNRRAVTYSGGMWQNGFSENCRATALYRRRNPTLPGDSQPGG
jgi:hypothetical protein